MKKFAITGSAGYVARKHAHAIKKAGGQVVLCHDITDNMGYIDSLFPYCKFTKDGEWFYNEIHKVDCVVVATPNLYHPLHAWDSLSAGVDVIMEKPITISPYEAKQLLSKSIRSIGNIYPVQQLELMDDYAEARKMIACTVEPGSKLHLSYHTYRGDWYHKSWKGNESVSGGLWFNMGIHMFSMMYDLFGPPQHITQYCKSDFALIGSYVSQSDVEIAYNMSIDYPRDPIRQIRHGHNYVNFKDKEFNEGHNLVYKHYLEGTLKPLHQTHVEVIDAVHKLQKEEIK